VSGSEGSNASAARGPFSRWTELPLYARILAGLVLRVAVGLALGPAAKPFDWPARIVLRVRCARAGAHPRGRSQSHHDGRRARKNGAAHGWPLGLEYVDGDRRGARSRERRTAGR
jgi:hypothetical protein